MNIYSYIQHGGSRYARCCSCLSPRLWSLRSRRGGRISVSEAGGGASGSYYRANGQLSRFEAAGQDHGASVEAAISLLEKDPRVAFANQPGILPL